MSGLVKTVGARLRQTRQAAGLSVIALADRAGVGRATLTQLEAGAGNPTLDTLYALANALGIPLSALIEQPSTAGPMVVVRHGEGTPIVGTAMRAVLLAHSHSADLSADLYSLLLPARARQDSAAHPPGTVEHVHVHAGTMTLSTPDEHADLEPGDYARFDGSRSHHYAAGDTDVHASLLITSTSGAASLS